MGSGIEWLRGGCIVACLTLAGCKPGVPKDECEQGLNETQQRLVSVERRLLNKLEQRRPGGAGEWLRATDALTQAETARADGDFQQCIAELERARRYLAEASRRY